MPDQDDMMQACMADLGQGRCDELPLSSKGTGLPSFAPSGRNGTSHYSNTFKADLKGLWASNEQYGGDENVRPWAKSVAAQYIQQHQAEIAAPRAQFNSNPPAGSRRNQATDGQAVGKLGGIVPPGAGIKFFNSSNQESNSINNNNNERNRAGSNATPLVAATVASQAQPRTAPALAVQPPTHSRINASADGPSLSAQCSIKLNPSPSDTDKDPVHTVCEGMCEMIPNDPQATTFLAKFEMRIHRQDACAMVFFSTATRGTSMHNVQDLEPPAMHGTRCLLSCRKDKGQAMYLLVLANQSETEEFKRQVELLQHVVSRFQEHASSSAVTSLPREAQGQPMHVDPVAAGPLENSSVGNASATSQAAQTVMDDPFVSPPNSSNHAERQAHDSMALIDFGRSPTQKETPAQEHVAVDAAESLFDIVRKVTPIIVQAGGEMSDDILRGIIDAAMDNWIHLGIMGPEDNSMKDELLSLVRALVGLKLRTKGRKGFPDTSNVHSFAGMANFEPPKAPQITSRDEEAKDEKTPSPRSKVKAKYTAAELQKLKLEVVPWPSASEQNGLSPASNASFQNRGQQWANVNGPVAGTATQAQAANLRPPARGLSSSRWATGRSDFEGNFTGARSNLH